MRLLFSKGIPYFLLRKINNQQRESHVCGDRLYLFISILISLLVQWLTESRFGKTKFGIPIEKMSLMSAGIGCTATHSRLFYHSVLDCLLSGSRSMNRAEISQSIQSHWLREHYDSTAGAHGKAAAGRAASSSAAYQSVFSAAGECWRK